MSKIILEVSNKPAEGDILIYQKGAYKNWPQKQLFVEVNNKLNELENRLSESDRKLLECEQSLVNALNEIKILKGEE